jgi:transcription factor SPN1
LLSEPPFIFTMQGRQEGYIEPQVLGQKTAELLPENQIGDAVDEEEDDDMVTAPIRDEHRETDADEQEEQRPAKKKKQRSAEVEDDNDGQEGREETEQDRRRREMLRKIDLAAKGPKKRPRKKADETDLDQVADDEVVRMRDMMQAAASEDQEANMEKRPATSKLRLLKEAVETLQK